MSLLRPSEEDAAFECAHADADLKKALMRLNELADLLEEACRDGELPPFLVWRIEIALLREYRDSCYEVAVGRPWQWEQRRHLRRR